MTDRPIIFSGPMVRALLARRKTQTRRLASSPLAKAKRGDRLYVRESARVGYHRWHHIDGHEHQVSYAADFDESGRALFNPNAHGGDIRKGQAPSAFPNKTFTRDGSLRWQPSIHMPRWASRLTLVVTEVRFEHLQDITEVDAIAEGIERVAPPPGHEDQPCGWESYETYPDGTPHPHAAAPNREARRSYAELWDMLHGVGSWDANPELVALTFTVHACNIDQMETA